MQHIKILSEIHSVYSVIKDSKVKKLCEHHVISCH